jgi:predicted NUDIX family phosphoesterase
MNKKHQEKILVVNKDKSIKPFLNQGGFDLNKEDLKEILKDFEFHPRYLMEEDPRYKQIIPYIAFINENKVLVYKRSKKSGEGRLHEKYSLGIGGHVDFFEEEKNLDPINIVNNAAIREVNEELGININKEDLIVDLAINDDSNEVGKVHYGVGFIINKKINHLDNGEKDVLIERKFMNKNEIEEIYDKLETWSQIFYDKAISKIIL